MSKSLCSVVFINKLDTIFILVRFIPSIFSISILGISDLSKAGLLPFPKKLNTSATKSAYLGPPKATSATLE